MTAADWGVRWPDDPDAVEEHPTEASARRVAAICSQVQLVASTDGGPWIPVPEEDTP